MVERESAIVEPCPLPVQLEAQPAVDPYLCHWSEFYFLALLSHLYLKGEKARVQTVTAILSSGQPVEFPILQKGSVLFLIHFLRVPVSG